MKSRHQCGQGEQQVVNGIVRIVCDGAKDGNGQPMHSPSQIKKLAHMYAGQSQRLNEGLAKKYTKSLADLSGSDDDDGLADAEAML